MSAAVLAGAALPRAASTQPAPARAATESPIEAAAREESALQFDAAAARLYQLVLEQPRAADVPAARLRLARVLGLTNDLPAALLECQAVRDGLPADHPFRTTALHLATLLSRRLRGAGAYFTTASPDPVKGMPPLDEPSAIEARPSGEYVLTDAGGGRAFRIASGAATAVTGMQEITAAAFLPGGPLVVAGKTGVTIDGTPVTLSGTWDGKPKQVRKVRAMAATSTGDLVLVEKDFEGLLRCRPAAGTCAPWGPAGKARTVKVGAADFVYVLDDRRQAIRVVEPGGRQIAAVGPTIGAARFGDVVDIAVDAVHGLYLLDKDTRRVDVLALRGTPGSAPGFVPVGAVALRPDMPRNPSALGVSPDGSLVVAGRSDARPVRIQ